MHAHGEAYLILADDEKLPYYITQNVETIPVPKTLKLPPPPAYVCLYISAGKKDKVSKGDIAGFLAKNITDDFLFRSNAKELWAMTAFLLGFGMRRERIIMAGGVPTISGRRRSPAVEPLENDVSDGVEPAAAAAPPPPHRQSESA